MAAADSVSQAEVNRLLQPLGTPFLDGVEIENLRGFRRVSLSLADDLILLVGPNNSGKTSIFRILDWLLNGADEDVLGGTRELNAAEQQLLIPARNTRGGARRIVVRVRIRDGRRHARFYAENGIARLRFRVRNNRVLANVRPPTRSEPLDVEEAALQLLRELRESTYFRHVPASRDVASQRFRDTLTTALEARFSERAIHQARAGAPGEYREVKRALDSLRDVAERLAAPLWKQMQDELMPTLSRDASLTLAVEAPDLVQWMARHIELKLITGEHDPQSVYPIEVGSGLQSLMDLAMFRGEEIPPNMDPILAIEEPEAFLHPTAQRTLARRLAGDDSIKRLVSTHSPIFVEEASYANVVLVRDHVVYEPPDLLSADRVAINSALLTGQGAEMAFSRGVLLVEGEGDKLFFETLRRRLAPFDPTGSTDELSVVWVGANSRFGPWMRLLEGYALESVRPIEWLAVADGADSSQPIRQAMADARVPTPSNVSTALSSVATAVATGNEVLVIGRVRALNSLARRFGTRIALLPVDLEYSALINASPSTLRRMASRIGVNIANREALLRTIGSKAGQGPIANPLKGPWMRGVIAQELPMREISADVRDVLSRWLRLTLGDARRANDVLRAAGVRFPTGTPAR
jgi:predicted ATP-dependent endonuclease of OLD family